ncbi:DNA adenine methylase [Micromonospora mirobrigensis]|uniref:site-specific DNA-methyltransferase (adenine-specific) n=2 Tax=Micromonospora mirobrigensis TaxID=262898 RepID=A0A1C4ZLU6_9ACTN|nr:DNA adenine methylase [Micromonospora mirobrigensis]
MTPFLRQAIAEQRPRPKVYVEPFAGGAGAALALLRAEVVDRVVLNDLNRGIAQFWRSVFSESKEFARLVELTKPTMDEWHRQRSIYLDAGSSGIELGFATFFLNRTNRSGILGARPIGGMEQTGNWKIDARYSAKDLAKRILDLGGYRHRVEIREQDGISLCETFSASDRTVFLNVDPPYLGQGDELYMNTLQWEDHVRLAKVLEEGPPYWVMTYGIDQRVPDVLYPTYPCAIFSISHTAYSQRVGREYLVISKNMRLSDLSGIGSRTGEWLPGRAPESAIPTLF